MRMNSTAKATKIARQPKISPIHPASAVPKARPSICPMRKRASTAWRRSYAKLSPIQASASGISAPIVAPEAKRAATSASRLGASAQAAEPKADKSEAPAIVRTRPKRSPSGPYTTCSRP